MKAFKILAVTLALTLLTVMYGSQAAIMTEETRLINDLLKDYNSLARPVINPNESVQVGLSMKVMKLQELNTKFQYISVLGWITTSWKDERLTWNKSDYGGLDYVAIPSSMLWVPTYALGNTASGNVYNEFWYSLFKVRVSYDGSMLWTPGGDFKAECKMDVSMFPFDDQICNFKFENWVYSGDKVNLTYEPHAEEEYLEYYTGVNEQWDIIGKIVLRNEIYFSPSPIPFPHVYFGLHFQRKSLFYVMNIILISVMLAFLVIFMFMLPSESGERVGMGMTLLLAFSVFILMINEHVPVTSRSVPLIIIYLVSFMGLTTLGVCESVIISYFFYHSGETAPPSLKVHREDSDEDLLNKDPHGMPQNNHLNHLDVQHREKGSNNIQYIMPSKIHLSSDIDRKHSSHDWPRSHDYRNYSNQQWNRPHDNRSHSSREWDRSHDIRSRKSFQSIDTHILSDDVTLENKRKWKDLARCVDKVFVCLCFCLFVLLMLILLVLVPEINGQKNLNEVSKRWHLRT